MKNVLISAYACIPNRGSEEANGWYYSSLISQQGFRVCCLTRDLGKDSIEQKMAESAYPNLTFVYVTMPRWLDKAYHKGLLGLYFHYLYWQWKAYRTARRLDQVRPFDLVHHVSYTSLQLGSFMYRLNRPFIFGPVGGGQEAPGVMRRYFKNRWTKEQMRSAVSKLMLWFNPGCYESVRQATHVLVWNEDTRRLVRSMGRQRAVSKEVGGVGNDFIPAEPLYRPAHAVLQLIWVGRLMPRKALELTLHALSKVAADVPVHLTVVGDGEMGRYVADYLNQYKLSNRVTWVGRIDYAEVKKHYRQADVFFFTSLRDTGPAQLIEAMGYSLPIVTLDLHGQAELVNDSTGIRVPITDPETVTDQLAEAIEWMYHHPARRVEMGLNAYQFARQQRWELRVRHIIQTYYTAAMGQEASPVRYEPIDR